MCRENQSAEPENDSPLVCLTRRAVAYGVPVLVVGSVWLLGAGYRLVTVEPRLGPLPEFTPHAVAEAPWADTEFDV